MARALVLLCVVFALAGCGGSADSPSSSGSAEPKTGLGGPTTPRQFTLPSKNIGCMVTTESARCDIGEKTWKPPAKPADCRQAWGNAVTVTAQAATLTCAGDTVMGSAEILAYGKAAQVGDFVCTSASAGVRCTHAPSGHGFTLARQEYTTF
ncbi:DUF6636 domain-containing protein [Actinoplanes sp. NPDC051633]|uniref:DUF6636 domain-containing protein n=1 Tax=Actinoplanes sp. NPDC051633 TaxID=3155670 RepID=UPI00341FC8A0